MYVVSAHLSFLFLSHRKSEKQTLPAFRCQPHLRSFLFLSLPLPLLLLLLHLLPFLLLLLLLPLRLVLSLLFLLSDQSLCLLRLCERHHLARPRQSTVGAYHLHSRHHDASCHLRLQQLNLTQHLLHLFSRRIRRSTRSWVWLLCACLGTTP